jgi:hypothetical protein
MLVTTPIGDLVEQLIWYPLIGQRQFRSLPPPEIVNGAALLVFVCLVVLPKVCVALGAVQVARQRFADRPLLLLTVFGALCQLQALGRGDYFHQAQAALPGILVLGLLSASTLPSHPAPSSSRQRSARLAGFALVSSACALCLVVGATGFARMEPGPLTPEDADLVAAVRTIDRNSAADEPIFVGLTGHRHTFFNDMIVYYLTGRPAGVHVAMFNPGVTNTESVQRQMVADLKGTNTQLLLLDDRWEFLAERTNQSLEPGSTVLDDFIGANFVVACRTGPFTLVSTAARAPDIACVAPRDEALLDILPEIGIP